MWILDKEGNTIYNSENIAVIRKGISFTEKDSKTIVVENNDIKVAVTLAEFEDTETRDFWFETLLKALENGEKFFWFDPRIKEK